MKKRVTLDRKGNPVIETRNKDGIYEREIDAEALARFKLDEMSVATTARKKTGGPLVGSNPYHDASVTDSKKLRKRSGLDYLRTLSVEIKKRRDTE